MRDILIPTFEKDRETLIEAIEKEKLNISTTADKNFRRMPLKEFINRGITINKDIIKNNEVKKKKENSGLTLGSYKYKTKGNKK